MYSLNDYNKLLELAKMDQISFEEQNYIQNIASFYLTGYELRETMNLFKYGEYKKTAQSILHYAFN